MSSTHLATALVIPFEHLRMHDVEVVGGKNASLGEMISQLAATGVRVPGGFATTAHAFRQFLQHGGRSTRWTPTTSTPWPPPARRSASGLSMRRSRPTSKPQSGPRSPN